jgi:hypothetical protein
MMSFKLFELAAKRYCEKCKKWCDSKDFVDTEKNSCKDCLQHVHKGEPMKRSNGGFMTPDTIILIAIVMLVGGMAFSFFTKKATANRDQQNVQELTERVRSLEISRNKLMQGSEGSIETDSLQDKTINDISEELADAQDHLAELRKQFQKFESDQEIKLASLKQDLEASLRYIPTTIELALKKFPTQITLVNGPEKSVVQSEVKKTKTGYTKTIKKFSRPLKKSSKKKKVIRADNQERFAARMNQ